MISRRLLLEALVQTTLLLLDAYLQVLAGSVKFWGSLCSHAMDESNYAKCFVHLTNDHFSTFAPASAPPASSTAMHW